MANWFLLVDGFWDVRRRSLDFFTHLRSTHYLKTLKLGRRSREKWKKMVVLFVDGLLFLEYQSICPFLRYVLI